MIKKIFSILFLLCTFTPLSFADPECMDILGNPVTLKSLEKINIYFCRDTLSTSSVENSDSIGEAFIQDVLKYNAFCLGSFTLHGLHKGSVTTTIDDNTITYTTKIIWRCYNQQTNPQMNL